MTTSPSPSPAHRHVTTLPGLGDLRPLRVLQCATFTDATPLAAHPQIDALEAPVTATHGRVLEGAPRGPFRWPRAAPPWPRTATRAQPPAEVDFGSLSQAVGGHTLLLVDLHGDGDPAPLIAAALATLPDRSHVQIACDDLMLAGRVRAWLPDTRVSLRISSERALRAYIEARIRQQVPALSVGVHEALLHGAPELDALRQHAPYVRVWGVTEAARAHALATWGVEAIASPALAVLQAI